MTDLQKWLGKAQTRTAEISAEQTRLLAITLDREIPDTQDALPGCWHWAWFNDALPPQELGRDGHPKRGGFLPPVPLPRRMWAGGSFEIHAPLEVGSLATKQSMIADIKHRSGKTGDLCIVTIAHEYKQKDRLCISEKQNLVFREDPKKDAPELRPPTPPQSPDLTRTFTPDPVLMFRYSALTFNGHRIHYDVDYARNIEGYPDIVFHAPLTATLLYELGGKVLGAPLRSFNYRATAPLFCNQPITLCAKQENDSVTLWAETPDGGQAMLAEGR